MGTHRDTGVRLDGLADVQQCAAEVMSTPLRSRPMQPDFGTDLMSIVDRPMNSEGIAVAAGLTADAITRWERRIQPRRVQVEVTGDGETTLTLDGVYAGRSLVASSAAPVTDATRLLGPAVYCEADAYDTVEGRWPSRLGGGALVAVPPALGLEAVPAPSTTGALGVRYDGASASVITGPYSAGPGSLGAPWTCAIAWRPDVYTARTVAAVHLVAQPGIWDPGAYALPLMALSVDDGAPMLGVGYPDAAGTTAEGPAEGPDADGWIVSWCWHRPGRVGWLTPDGPREVVVGPASMTGLEPGDAAVMLTIGGMWSGSGLVPAAGPMSTWIPRFAIWPRVLTRRERMSIGALWRRELRA